MKRFSLKTKIALYVLLIFTTLVPAITWISLNNFKMRLKQAIEKQQTALVMQLSNELDDKIVFAQEALVGAAAFVTPTIARSVAESERFLDHLPALNSIFDNNLLLIDSEGKIIAETGRRPSRTGKSLAFRDYVKETLQRRKPVISRPFVSSLPHAPMTIMFTAPVKNSDGKLIAILGGSIDLQKKNFIAKLAGIRIGRTGHIDLFDTERTIIVHPDRQMFMKKEAPPGVNRRLDLALSGTDNVGETRDSTGEYVLAAYKKLQNINWIVGVTFPLNEAYAPVRQAEKTAFTIIVTGAIFIVGVMWLIMRHLTLPLLSLTDQIRKLEQTHDYRPVNITSHDEIEELAKAFNSLMLKLKNKEERLYYISTHDTLTGLYNRAFLEAEVDRLSKSRDFPVSIVAADLDGLKKVNDTLGHSAGDDMIRTAAEALSEAFRAEDIIARVGGDEFIVLLPNTDAAAAEAALQRIKGVEIQKRESIRSYCFSMSVGVATAETNEGFLPAMRMADIKMYKEKAYRHACSDMASGQEKGA